jgi:hypothetical protein
VTDALATVCGVLDTAVRDSPAEALPDLLGVLAAASARVQLRLQASAPTAEAVPLVDAEEMARILDVPENWVRDKARARALPCRQLGHYVRFNPAEVLEAVRTMPALHDSRLRGLKTRKENRGGSRRLSTECPTSGAELADERQPDPP